MSEKKKFWKMTAFWENIKKTIAIFSGPTVLGLHEFGAADKWMIIAASLGFVGAILSIWIADNNKDGIVDLFE